MSTNTHAAPATVSTMDVSGTRRPALARLVLVELRKMADTRSGFWLLIAIAVIAVGVTTAFFVRGTLEERAFLPLMAFGGVPLGVLLPVLGILLITSEWGQRTTLVTFTLTPQRGRVLTAKFAAAVLFAFGAIVILMALAALLAAVGGSPEPFAQVTAAVLARGLLGLEISVLTGLAFGAAFLNSALAIVLYFVLPTAISIVGQIWTGVADKLIWVNLTQSSSLLFRPETLTGTQWAHIGVGAILWVLIPAGVGLWRVLRSDPA